ncbi:sarcosine oxidase [Streptoalloteichus tenebrarius]|uniref:Sarcosine oxidase n=1 Tax=Streptoalloteichus tenebrarius (strain ATCC 17920 / DSM 40477 / JCM 4838 / CBS 697.72 / NBRC 16177 / NCIMB 11028 / NRRL B-12390 / A12253. 1 / ISP 5477) TaxID=1933 RepID=A0ABT1HUA8_STRSD|nr:N-methyl-L-tryptophan oxidase [Streptoalloteichus tenebrarius]MCP2259113.1 sarcosine oxidase [Streptoalloteichus tenebrarius]BFE99561.1 N-methyl-L-tryptophan oxidase [Streptoalloteichus tenebrarius]
MRTAHDVVVIGLGGMGSAAAWSLAARSLAGRSLRVLGLEQFGPAHDRGSSHGGSRIIRHAYFEDPAYVPLVLRAHELWEAVEREAGRRLLWPTGGLMVGRPDGPLVAGSRHSARRWDLPHEILDAREIRARFPVFAPRRDEVGLFEARAGIVAPEAAVTAHLELAAKAGADLRFGCRVLRWEALPGGEGVRVVTSEGDHHAGHAVICPGAWAPDLLANLGVPFTVERQVQFWFSPRGGTSPYTRLPIFIWEDESGERFYGVPPHAGSPDGVKVAFYRRTDVCTADAVDRVVRQDEVDAIARHVESRVPTLPGTFLRATTCLYTNTPDRHFVIATHPDHPQVTVACGFSGHGFKFVPVVAEILTDLVTTGRTPHPIALFDPRRDFRPPP